VTKSSNVQFLMSFQGARTGKAAGKGNLK